MSVCRGRMITEVAYHSLPQTSHHVQLQTVRILLARLASLATLEDIQEMSFGRVIVVNPLGILVHIFIVFELFKLRRHLLTFMASIIEILRAFNYIPVHCFLGY